MKKSAANPAPRPESPSPGKLNRTESILEDLLQHQLEAIGIASGFEREVRFHPTRKWRFDFAARQFMLGIEVDGGIWGGRHTRGGGFQKDHEKMNEAAMLGWAVLRFTDKMIKTGEAARMVERYINERAFKRT